MKHFGLDNPLDNFGMCLDVSGVLRCIWEAVRKWGAC